MAIFNSYVCLPEGTPWLCAGAAWNTSNLLHLRWGGCEDTGVAEGLDRPMSTAIHVKRFILRFWIDLGNMGLFKVIFYFPNGKSTIWGIYSE